jgi:hypothetical protein
VQFSHHRLTRILFLIGGLVFLIQSTLQAEPYFSAWTGLSCDACHVNQTGGYMRTTYGQFYGSHLQTFHWKGFVGETTPPHEKHQPYLTVGADLYVNYEANQGQSNFFINRQNFYADLHVNSKLAGVFTITNLGLGENYLLIHGLPQEGFIKVGIFQVPYGLMLQDDNSLVRSPLGFSYQRVDEGMEMGMTPTWLNHHLMVCVDLINSTSPNLNAQQKLKAFSTWDLLTFRPFTLGWSYYQNEGYIQAGSSSTINTTPMQSLNSVFGWTHISRFVILGEYDRGFDQNPQLLSIQYPLWAFHVSVETDLGHNVYLRYTREFLHPSPGDPNLIGLDSAPLLRQVLSLRLFPIQDLLTEFDFEVLSPQDSSTQEAFLATSHLFF